MEQYPGFAEAMEGKPNDWKCRAVAGLVTREVYGDSDWAREHGLTRACLPSEREAWLFGFDWVDMALLRARTMLCDLLQGRMIRRHAEEGLQVALDVERYGAPAEVVTKELERAAHWEWMASITERGQVLWGNRSNRCGRPEEVNDG